MDHCGQRQQFLYGCIPEPPSPYIRSTATKNLHVSPRSNATISLRVYCRTTFAVHTVHKFHCSQKSATITAVKGHNSRTTDSTSLQPVLQNMSDKNIRASKRLRTDDDDTHDLSTLNDLVAQATPANMHTHTSTCTRKPQNDTWLYGGFHDRYNKDSTRYPSQGHQFIVLKLIPGECLLFLLSLTKTSRASHSR